MQRVAKHLYRRGNAYTYRRAIPPYARADFGGISEYVRSLGDVTETRAMTLRAVCQEYCDQLIAKAKTRHKPSSGVTNLLRVKHVPDVGEIEQAVRGWLLDRETECGSHTASGSDVDARVRDLGFLNDEVVRVMRARKGVAPLMTQWIADALIAANDWSVPASGDLRHLVEDRVARGQRELVARTKADMSWEDQPPPTHRMFSSEAFAADRAAPPPEVEPQPQPLWDIFDGYRAEQEPKPDTVKAWKSALTSLIKHLGHDDATRVRSEDIVAWKNALLAPGTDGEKLRGQRTVRHKYIGVRWCRFPGQDAKLIPT